ncbi:MAG TPA: hypothetical protein VFG91_07855 [Woeseiaceae bacterium]|nr:hypothetical protein [Woeseiaceae bacterium]
MKIAHEWNIAVALLPMGILIGAGAALGQAPFPEGPGRDTLLQVCTQCHAPNRILEADATADEWQFILYDMIARGAPVHEDDVDVLEKYLIDNFAVK